MDYLCPCFYGWTRYVLLISSYLETLNLYLKFKKYLSIVYVDKAAIKIVTIQ